MGGGLFWELRQAGRRMIANPGFTLAAVLILAVGIGANAATFSVINGVLLRPLPYPDSEAVVSVGQVPVGFSGAVTLSSVELRQLQEDAHSFEQLGGFRSRLSRWSGPDGPVRLAGSEVTPSVFELLRTSPHLGRLFTENDAIEGAQRVALLSYRVWSSRFGSEQAVIGAPVVLNEEPHTVLGVLPEDFGFPFPETDIWTPLVVSPYETEASGAGPMNARSFMGVGRLRDGVSPERAESEARVIIERAVSEQPRLPGLHRETRVTSMREDQGRPFRPALLLLAVSSGLVLLVTCANVAGVLLARGIARQRELAIRGALGAGRGRIVRQLLVESVVLSTIAGAVGLAVASGIVRAAPALTPGYVPRLAEVGIDEGVLAFTATVSVVAGVLFGTAPALVWSRVDLACTLNDATAASAGGFGRLRANRGQAVLAVAQVALAVVLLAGAGLLLRSFVSLVTYDPGFERANVVVAEIADPVIAQRAEPYRLADVEARNARARRKAAELLARLERIAVLPGVDAVALSANHLLNRTGSLWPFEVGRGSATSDPGREMSAFIRDVTPDFADVVGLRLRAGRFFTDGDTEGAPRVAVVSESFAQNAFGSEAAAVGQRIAAASQASRYFDHRDGRGDGERGPLEWVVIGVVADIRPPFGLVPVDADDGAVYLSMLQPGLDDIRRGGTGRMPFVVVRTEGDPIAVVSFLREAVADLRPGARVDATALDTALSAQAARPRFYALCALSFGLVALSVTAFGLYSMLSYIVSQRRREIGIRMALGAGRGQAVRLVVGQGGALVAGGLLLGLLAAPAVGRIIESLLFGVGSFDPLTFTVVTTVVICVGLLACWLPASRAARVDPMDVLREA